MDLIPKEEVYIKSEPEDVLFHINNSPFEDIKEQFYSDAQVKQEEPPTFKFEEVQIKSEILDIKTQIKDEKIDIIPEECLTEELGVEDQKPHESSSIYKCDICDYRATGKAKLHWHKCIHTGETVFSCNECEYKTTRELYFHRHTISHTRKNRFKCKLCEYSAARRYYYERHMITHTREKPFKCSLCDYEASQKHHMQRHMSIHTGEKPFKCTQCDYKTAYKHTMLKHKKTHLSEKYFKCNKCDFRTRVKFNYQMHVHNKERPFKCKLCDYKAAQKHYLQQHMLTHVTEKPFKCKDCNYETAYKRNIIMHQQNHLTGKLFKCVKCDYKTAVKSNFEMHIHNVVQINMVVPATNLNVKKRSLQEKKKSGTGRPTYKCSECNYKTRVKRLFEMHLPTHVKSEDDVAYSSVSKVPQLMQNVQQNSENKFFKCSVCDYRTIVERNFKMHVHSLEQTNSAHNLPDHVIPTTVFPSTHINTYHNVASTQSATITAPGVSLNSGFVYVVSPLQTLNQNYYFQI